MVNAPRMMREQRDREINKIVASIKKAVEEGKTISYNKLVLACMSDLNLSKPTAQNYIQIAFYRAGIDGEEIQKKEITEKAESLL